MRVEAGGHNIPKEVIIRRYHAGMTNLSKLYQSIADYWLIIDNSEPPFQIVAEGIMMDEVKIYNYNIYNQIIKP